MAELVSTLNEYNFTFDLTSPQLAGHMPPLLLKPELQNLSSFPVRALPRPSTSIKVLEQSRSADPVKAQQCSSRGRKGFLEKENTCPCWTSSGQPS